MIEDIKLKDFCKETKELFKRLPKVKQYKGNLMQQVRQYRKDLNNER